MTTNRVIKLDDELFNKLAAYRKKGGYKEDESAVVTKALKKFLKIKPSGEEE